MIIDNSNIKKTEESKDSNFKDTTVNQVVRVQYEADPVILELATNLEMMKSLYQSKGTFEDFVKVANDLLADKYDGKNSLDILYENKDFIYDQETIDLLETVSNKIIDIEKVSQNVDGIDEINSNIDYIKDILPAISDILITSKSIKDIQRIGRNIEKVRVLHTHIIKIITLFDSINELHTIYNYLPYLLKLSLFLNNYSKLLTIVIERFDYYGKVIDNHILEFQEFNRHITYNLNHFESEVQKVIDRINQIDASAIDQFRETLEKLVERVTILEEKLKDGVGTTYDDTEIRNLIQQLQELITQLQQSITDIENRLTKVEGDIATINTKITNIKSDITNINGDITNIKGDITTIQGDITRIDNSINDVKTDITTINEAITTINNTIAEIKQNNVKILAGKNIEVEFDEPNNSYTINSTATGGGVATELKYSQFTLTNI